MGLVPEVPHGPPAHGHHPGRSAPGGHGRRRRHPRRHARRPDRLRHAAIGLPRPDRSTRVGWVDFAWGLVKTRRLRLGRRRRGRLQGADAVGRSAEEVGRATTESVVLSVTLIIVLDCIFAFVLIY
ncbi:MAG: ABC transporter permease [Ignavibacteriales bacterium]|nr:ABC transporter permease [Ignavibacteriales bacterium]